MAARWCGRQGAAVVKGRSADLGDAWRVASPACMEPVFLTSLSNSYSGTSSYWGTSSYCSSTRRVPMTHRWSVLLITPIFLGSRKGSSFSDLYWWWRCNRKNCEAKFSVLISCRITLHIGIKHLHDNTLIIYNTCNQYNTMTLNFYWNIMVVTSVTSLLCLDMAASSGVSEAHSHSHSCAGRRLLSKQPHPPNNDTSTRGVIL